MVARFTRAEPGINVLNYGGVVGCDTRLRTSLQVIDGSLYIMYWNSHFPDASRECDCVVHISLECTFQVGCVCVVTSVLRSASP
jgi:hypothetical protein